jgi:serine/threonine-protein kinase
MSQGLIGEKLGSFRIESVLGSGAMGVVYRGINETNGKTAAIKVVSGEINQRSKVYERFKREAEILQQFRHPHIVRFLAVGRYKGTSYIAMEFIQGDTLEKRLSDRGSLPWREVVELGVQICDALHYAHEHGVVHRDLKPSNLMVNEQGKIKLTDFGIAKDLDATALTATGRTLGTAAYMAPEQIRGTPAVSHKTDLYALGVLLYQLLVGRPPFEGNSPMILMHAHLNEPPPHPSARLEQIPVVLDDLIVSLMAKQPSDRPWDAAAVGMVFRELKEKADRGEPIAMVWPEAGSPAANPPRAGATVDAGTARTRRNSKKSNKNRTSALSASAISGAAERSSWLTRSAIETALLVLGLLVTGGLIVYLLIPPGAEALYARAETLMASSRRHDWITARDDFLDPLDQRFPDNPYKEQTTKWRNKILLDEAEGRARILDSPVKTGFSDPANNAERQYVITSAVAAEASKRGDDITARHQWLNLAQEMKPDDPDERKWHLLATKRADDLQHAMEDRRTYVIKQLALSDAAFRAGRPVEAVTIRSKLVDQFAHYTDLADLFAFATPEPVPPSVSPVQPQPETEPKPQVKGKSDSAPEAAPESDSQKGAEVNARKTESPPAGASPAASPGSR